MLCCVGREADRALELTMTQGNFAVSYSKSVMGDEAVAVFNIWRLAEGKIVEHWSNAETIGPRDAWGNSGKF